MLQIGAVRSVAVLKTVLVRQYNLDLIVVPWSRMEWPIYVKVICVFSAPVLCVDPDVYSIQSSPTPYMCLTPYICL